MTKIEQFDGAQSVDGDASAPAAAGAIGSHYPYNDAHQRVWVELGDGSFWLYE